MRQIKIEDVAKVYSGKPGCMCGCNGKYSVMPQHCELASKWRGYKITDDEVSERSVKTIVNKMNKQADKLEWDKEGLYVALETETRTYAVYFAEGMKKNVGIVSDLRKLA